MAMMIVKRVGVLSFAKMQSLVMAFLGLFIGILYGVIFMVVGAAMFSRSGSSSAGAGASSVVIGLVMMIAIPIFYGVIGFIFGALGAFIYNIAAGFIGGMELDLEPAMTEYAAPPPQWGTGSTYQPGSQQQPL